MDQTGPTLSTPVTSFTPYVTITPPHTQHTTSPSLRGGAPPRLLRAFLILCLIATMSWIQESHTIPLAYLQVIPDLKVRALHTKPARAFSAQHEAGPQPVSSPFMPARPLVEQLSDTLLSASSPHLPARPLVEQLSDSLLSASDLHIYHPARAPPVQHESDQPSDLAPIRHLTLPCSASSYIGSSRFVSNQVHAHLGAPIKLLWCLTSTSGPASIGSSLELRSCESDQKLARAFSAQHEAGPQPVSSPFMPARPLVEQLSDTLLSASSYARNKAPNRVCI